MLKPGAYREALVEGYPDEGAHFPRACIVPYPGDHLRRGGVAEVKVLHEGEDARRTRKFLSISVSSFWLCIRRKERPPGGGWLASATPLGPM